MLQEKGADLGKQGRRILVDEHRRNPAGLFPVKGIVAEQEQRNIEVPPFDVAEQIDPCGCAQFAGPGKSHIRYHP